MGYALYIAQCGDKHPSAKPLKGFKGAGVVEVVEDFDGDTYFPEIDSKWSVENIDSHSCLEFNYSYITYIRK